MGGGKKASDEQKTERAAQAVGEKSAAYVSHIIETNCKVQKLSTLARQTDVVLRKRTASSWRLTSTKRRTAVDIVIKRALTVVVP